MVFLKIKVYACILICLINNCFFENDLKLAYFSYIAKENWKEDWNSNKRAKSFPPGM